MVLVGLGPHGSGQKQNTWQWSSLDEMAGVGLGRQAAIKPGPMVVVGHKRPRGGLDLNNMEMTLNLGLQNKSIKLR